MPISCYILYGMLVPGLLPERRSCHKQYATHTVHVVSKHVKETSGSCCRYCASVSFFLAHGPTCKRVKSDQKKPLPNRESIRCGMLLQLKDWATNLGFSQSKWLQMKLWWTVQPPFCCLTWSGWTLGYFGPWLMGSNIFEYRVPGCVVPHVSLCKMLQSVSKHNSKSGAAVSAMLDPASLAHSQKKGLSSDLETLGTCGHMGAMHGIAMACVSAPCFSSYQYGNSRPVFCHAQPPCFKLGSQILASRRQVISVWSMIDHGTNAGANQELQNDR